MSRNFLYRSKKQQVQKACNPPCYLMQELLTGEVSPLALTMNSSREAESGTATSPSFQAKHIPGSASSAFHEVLSKYTAYGSQAEKEALQGQLDELARLKRSKLKGGGGDISLSKVLKFALGLTKLVDAVLEKASIPCSALHMVSSTHNTSMTVVFCFSEHQASPALSQCSNMLCMLSFLIMQVL